eukprot:991112_1
MDACSDTDRILLLAALTSLHSVFERRLTVNPDFIQDAIDLLASSPGHFLRSSQLGDELRGCELALELVEYLGVCGFDLDLSCLVEAALSLLHSDSDQVVIAAAALLDCCVSLDRFLMEPVAVTCLVEWSDMDGESKTMHDCVLALLRVCARVSHGEFLELLEMNCVDHSSGEFDMEFYRDLVGVCFDSTKCALSD